jgi:hypothetical protein
LRLNDKNAVIGLSNMNPATGFSGEQELEQEAGEGGHADREAVEAGSAGQAATVQAGTACEDRDAN